MTQLELEFYESGKRFFKNATNWEQRRYEIAKEVIAHPYGVMASWENEKLAKNAVQVADALIAELRK